METTSIVSLLAPGLAATLAIAFVTWLVSLAISDVSIVDVTWSLMVVAPALVAAWPAEAIDAPAIGALLLAALWAARLALHIALRHDGEDRRYQQIRARNQPHFEWKSLYLVFVLQAVLAWIVSMPLVALVAAPATAWHPLEAAGLVLAAAGLVIEAVADAQLTRFRADPANRGQVMGSGLWRYSRHPNYFGEFCIWWGLYLVALSVGAGWTILSPLLMSVLLLRVSGVSLLEKDIGERRPAYRDYIARTNAFFPWRPR